MASHQLINQTVTTSTINSVEFPSHETQAHPRVSIPKGYLTQGYLKHKHIEITGNDNVDWNWNTILLAWEMANRHYI